MAVFEFLNGSPIPHTIDHVAGSGWTMKVIAGKGEQLPTNIAAVLPAVAKVININPNSRLNTTIFQLEGIAPGQASLTAGVDHRTTAGNLFVTLAAGPIAVNVLPKLVLPAAATDAGLLARLFLAETLGPLASSSYNLADAKTSMRLMHVVVSNRLKTPSALWGSANARTLQDVVQSHSQFAGFEQYPTLASGVQYVIDQVVILANQGSNANLHLLRDFVQAAFDEAAQKNPIDPSSTGLYWWRTGGSGAPTNTAKVYRTVSHNTFYMK